MSNANVIDGGSAFIDGGTLFIEQAVGGIGDGGSGC